MPKADQTELSEARALAEATMTALDRFGLQLSYEELKRLVASLDQANELLKGYQTGQEPRGLLAAMTAIDQVRQFLVRNAPRN
jgi:hypothetical protein